jgi:hypothetical protein
LQQERSSEALRMRIEFIGPEHRSRNQAEAHVRAVYRDAYGADVRAFAPLLVAARDSADRMVCVAGIRTAADGFFSSVYLDQPIDRVLSGFGHGRVAPGEALEVVSLASSSPFPVLPVLDAVIGWARERRIGWAVFTATRPLRRLLGRAGMPFTELCAARAERLTDASEWGQYYEADPWVCAYSDTLRQPLRLSRRPLRQAGAS